MEISRRHALRLAATSALALAGTTTSGPRAQAVAAGAALGVYAGPRNISGYQSFKQTYPQACRALDFLPASSLAGMSNCSWLVQPYLGIPLELSVPMQTDDASVSVAGLAAGNATMLSAMRRIATVMRDNGQPSGHIRLGWEMNGNWYAWSANNTSCATWISAYRNTVTAMREVAPGLRFVWSGNVGTCKTDSLTIWPGDDVVDVASVDAYDYSWRYTNVSAGNLPAARSAAWNDLLNGTRGLQWWASFASSHGVPLVISEWGVSDGSTGGGDNAAYIANISAFAQANCAWASYFNVKSGVADHRLSQFPAAAAQFGTSWGGG